MYVKNRDLRWNLENISKVILDKNDYLNLVFKTNYNQFGCLPDF